MAYFLKYLCLMVSIMVLISNILATDKSTSLDKPDKPDKSDKCTCHMSELDSCVVPIHEMFTKISQGTSTEPGDEFDFICQKLSEAKDCRNKYYEQCSAPAMKEALNGMLFQSVDRAAESFCKNDRDNYVKNSKCLSMNKQLTQACAVLANNFLRTSHANGSLAKVKPMNLQCCVLMKAHNCTLKVIETHCGKDAVDLTNSLAEAMGTQSAQKMCNNLHYDPAICE